MAVRTANIIADWDTSTGLVQSPFLWTDTVSSKIFTRQAPDTSTPPLGPNPAMNGKVTVPGLGSASIFPFQCLTLTEITSAITVMLAYTHVFEDFRLRIAGTLEIRTRDIGGADGSFFATVGDKSGQTFGMSGIKVDAGRVICFSCADGGPLTACHSQSRWPFQLAPVVNFTDPASGAAGLYAGPYYAQYARIIIADAAFTASELEEWRDALCSTYLGYVPA